MTRCSPTRLFLWVQKPELLWIGRFMQDVSRTLVPRIGSG